MRSEKCELCTHKGWNTCAATLVQWLMTLHSGLALSNNERDNYMGAAQYSLSWDGEIIQEDVEFIKCNATHTQREQQLLDCTKKMEHS